MTAARYWSWSMVWDFLLDKIPLEKGVLSFEFLSFGSSASSKIILSVKGYGARGWLCAYGWVTIL
jgi:hypothetical protein